MEREEHKFPTRQYPYKKEGEILPEETKIKNISHIKKGIPSLEMKEFPRVFRFILGIDAFPNPLKKEELEKLDDTFANLFLKRNTIPLTLNEILTSLDSNSTLKNELPNQTSFLVADGGQIAWSTETDNLNRQFRLVISRSDAKNDLQILISTSTIPDSKTQFLQLISWDNTVKAYNFYERRDQSWFWAGNSYHALTEPSRGQGPFDSHVNGAIVMKELKFPWIHWHSMNASINDDVLSPNDNLRNEKLWINKSGGQDFEIQIAKPAIVKWNNSRLQNLIDTNRMLNSCHDFFRQVVTTTTINIVTTKEESKSINTDSNVRIPETFFFNKDVLIDEIGLEPLISPIHFKGSYYLDSLIDFDFQIGDNEFRFKGDTHFAFLVPEVSFEDVNLISILLSNKIVSKKFISSLLMVDFTNPVYSTKREIFLKYFPNIGSIDNNFIESAFLNNIRNSTESQMIESSEALFLSNYELAEDEWKGIFEKRIENYFNNLQTLLENKDGFYEIVKLAESRRREFRKTDLAEFRLTTPTTNIKESAELLQITESAKIIIK
nr:hypothetical protein [uncultured Flavobacterium sp.]